MTDQIKSTVPTEKSVNSDFSTKSWVLANATGLGVTYGLFALIGDLVEYGLDVTHDSPQRNAALLVAVIAGASLFTMLRRRVLAEHLPEARRAAIAAAAGLSFGLIIGFAVGGPPIDFVLGAIALGVVGGTTTWRALRHRVVKPGGLLAASIGGWFIAGIAAGAVAFTGDALNELLGSPRDGSALGIASFTLLLTLIGLVGGTVGGLIEGSALRRRLGAD